MAELFKTVLILSVFGFGLTALLLCLKPITAKNFPAKWQYYVWLAVLFSMIIPAYKLIPPKEAKKLPLLPQKEVVQEGKVPETVPSPEPVIIEETPMAYREVHIAPHKSVNLLDLASYIWLFGVCVYLIIVIGSYCLYLTRKRKTSIAITDTAVLDEVKKELGIKRRIKVRMAKDFTSPMLVGVLFPVIYIPCREIPAAQLRMVFLHELMHYKRKDLVFKWLSLFVNAVHWFNPLAYLVCSNISEACEVSCDMAVTKTMSETEQKIYMQTILDLAK